MKCSDCGKWRDRDRGEEERKTRTVTRNWHRNRRGAMLLAIPVTSQSLAMQGALLGPHLVWLAPVLRGSGMPIVHCAEKFSAQKLIAGYQNCCKNCCKIGCCGNTHGMPRHREVGGCRLVEMMCSVATTRAPALLPLSQLLTDL